MAEINWTDLKPLSLDDKDLVQVPWSKYYQEKFQKTQIVLHHTVSGPGIEGDLETWKSYKDHIGTCIIIGRDGKINQLFSSAYWAWHLGCGRRNLDQGSIAVELDNWGQLHEKDGDILTSYNSKLSDSTPVTHYPTGFRGETMFESYPYEQLKALGELILLWHKAYSIPLTYNEDMWDVSPRALGGTPGIWTHVSYLPYPKKWDCHPDPNLISLLKTLPSLV